MLMKKAKLFFSALFVLIATTLSAQNITVAGKITDSATGEGAAFASVQVRGTTLGTIADVDGNYSLNAPADGTLVFSSVGYVTQVVAIGGRRNINVAIEPDAESLEQVVVTAQGLTRKEKAIGYSTVKIEGEDLTMARQTDLGQSLAGKISGARFFSSSGATFGSGSIVLRGTTSYNDRSGSEPIYVVDGTITNKNAVNMDDIESVNVLKGPAATALYGSQGGNGAVIITTRRAVAGESRIDFSHTITMERFYNHFRMQTLYGGGNYGISAMEDGMLPENANVDTMDPTYAFRKLKNEDGSYRMDYAVDENWGPRYNPNVLVASPLYYDPTSSHYMKADPWVHGLDLRDLFQTGWNNTTNVAFSKGTQDLLTRVSFTNSSRTGVVPNSKADRRYLTVNTNFKPTSWFRINLDYKFTYRKNQNASGEGYSSNGNQLDDFTQWAQGNINLKDYMDWQRPDGSWRTWNPKNAPKGNFTAAYHENPYAVYATRNSYSTYIWNVITGDAEFSLPFNIKLGARVMGNIRNYTSESKYAGGSVNYNASYSQSKDNTQDLTYQGRITWGDYFFNDRLHVDAAAFIEQKDYHYTTLSGNTSKGLTIPDLYNLSNSVDYVSASNSETNYKTRSVYGNVTASWDDTYFVDLSLRNDWDSRLPSAANSYLYGGASVSVMLSQLIKADWLRYWKLRASAAQVGSTLGAYATTYTYSTGKYNTTITMSNPSTQLNQQIKPTISTSFEVGTEFRMFGNRLRGDINLYRRDSKNQIINVNSAAQSGYSSRQLNAGLVRNQGIEISLGGTPIQTRDFSWDIDFNIAKNVNTLVKLSDDMHEYNGGTSGFNYKWGLTYREGEPVGTIYSQCRFIRDDQGRLVLFPTPEEDKIQYGGDYRPWFEGEGYESQAMKNQDIGNFQPDFTGGFSTTFRYKTLSLSAAFDFTIGGDIISYTNLWGEAVGMLDYTAAVNDKGVNVREPVAKGGGVRIDGVDTNGKPLTTYINAYYYYYVAKQTYDIGSYMFKRSYLKMRELALTYSVPRDIMNKVKGISSASVSLIASNPWLIYSAVPYIDPSESGSNWQEGGQAASTRSFGVTVKLTF